MRWTRALRQLTLLLFLPIILPFTVVRFLLHDQIPLAERTAYATFPPSPSPYPEPEAGCPVDLVTTYQSFSQPVDTVSGASPSPPQNLIAYSVGSNVVLSWVNAQSYDSIMILRDGVVVEFDLPGTSTSFVTAKVTGEPCYEINVFYDDGEYDRVDLGPELPQACHP